MTTRLAAPAALLLAMAHLACDIKVADNGGLSFDVAEGKAADEWVRTYTVQPGGRVEIVNSFGNIEAFAAKGAEVEVTAVRELRMRTPEEAQAALKETQMIEEAAPDRVRIETPRRQRDGDEGIARGYLSVRYRIGVPPGLAVTLKTENGEVRIEGVDSAVTASTTNGNINVKGTAGPLEARNVNGGMTIEVKGALKGDLSLHGVNGGIRVTLPENADADIEISAVNGGVSVSAGLEKGLVTSQKGRQRLAGRLNKGGPKVLADIVNGGIRLSNGGND